MNGEITKPENNINGRLRDFPGIDSTLEIAGMAADSKAVGDVLRLLADGHNKQNAAIRELKGYINGMLQMGNLCMIMGVDDPYGDKFKEKMPGLWTSLGRTIPLSEDGTGGEYVVMMCYGDTDDAKQLHSGESE